MLLIVALFATALLLGAMAFFSAVVAPLVFAKLDRETAGRFIRELFPWYYLVIIGLALVGGLALTPVRTLDAVWLFGIAAAGVVSRQVLLPRMSREREAVRAGDDSREPVIKRLHRLSMWINITQMVIAAIVLARFA